MSRLDEQLSALSILNEAKDAAEIDDAAELNDVGDAADDTLRR